MAKHFDIDDDAFQRDMNSVLRKAEDGRDRAQEEAGDELLRLSQAEVPHDVGTLQNSGHTERDHDDVLVGYGGAAAPYAARLHEHPEYRFQKGRKGKFLEDPLVRNLKVLQQHIIDGWNKVFDGGMA